MTFRQIHAGERFGRLQVLTDRQRGETHLNCICDCGTQCSIHAHRWGTTRSCGCWQREATARANTTHGLSKTPEYSVWEGMWTRCTNPRSKFFKHYGGRGIKICDRWRDFAAFFADMGERPTADHSIDRIDNDGNYEPENCRWATTETQLANRRPYTVPTHCKNGHEYRPGSYWPARRGRKCKECSRENLRRLRERRRNEREAQGEQGKNESVNGEWPLQLAGGAS